MTNPTKVLALGAGLALALAAASARAETVEFKHIAAKVVILPEARSDIQVSIIKSNPRLPIWVRKGGPGVTRVDGGQRDGWPHFMRPHPTRCRVGPDGTTVHVVGVGAFREDELPQILVRTPLAAKVSSDGAVIGSLPAADSLDLSIAGCDTWTIGVVKNHLDLNEAGDGRIRTGDLGSAHISIAGSADVATKAIARGLDLNISGSGDLTAASVAGDIDINIAGSGHVRINGGRAGVLRANVAGTGEITDQGRVEQLRLSTAGTADVHITEVAGQKGPVDRKIEGFGEIKVGP